MTATDRLKRANRWALAAAALVVTGGLLPRGAAAEDVATVDAGSRIRLVLARDHSRVVGRIKAADDERIVLEHHGARTVFLRDQIESIEVQRGGRSRQQNGVRGAIIGGAVGVAVGFAMRIGDGGGEPYPTMKTWSPAVPVKTGAALAVAGGLVGIAVTPSERWQRADSRVRLAFSPMVGAATKGIVCRLEF